MENNPLRTNKFPVHEQINLTEYQLKNLSKTARSLFTLIPDINAGITMKTACQNLRFTNTINIP